MFLLSANTVKEKLGEKWEMWQRGATPEKEEKQENKTG